MFCPQCRVEYREGFFECSDCRVPLVNSLPAPEPDPHAEADSDDLDALIQTGLASPLAISLAMNLLQEAGIPFVAMDQNVATRQESGNFIGWWNVRVPANREDEAREILWSLEEMK